MIHIMQTTISSLLSGTDGRIGAVRRFGSDQWGDQGGNEEIMTQLFTSVLQQMQQQAGGSPAGLLQSGPLQGSQPPSVISHGNDSVTDHSQHQKIPDTIPGMFVRHIQQGDRAIDAISTMTGSMAGTTLRGPAAILQKLIEGIGGSLHRQADAVEPGTFAGELQLKAKVTGHVAVTIPQSQRGGTSTFFNIPHSSGEDLKPSNPLPVLSGLRDNVLNPMPLQNRVTTQPIMQQAMQDASPLQGDAQTKAKESAGVGEAFLRQVVTDSKPVNGNQNQISSTNIQTSITDKIPKPANSGEGTSSDSRNQGNSRGSTLQEVTVLHLSSNNSGEKPLFTNTLQQTQQIAQVKNPAAMIPEITLEKTAAKTAEIVELPRTSLNDIVRAISMRHGQDSSEIKFKLKPEHLGELVIRVRMEGGKMIAQAEVVHASVKAALEHQLPQLREMLASKGIDLQRFDVYSEKHSGSEDGKNGRWPQHTEDRSKRESPIDAIDSYHTKRSLGYNTIELVF